METPHRDQVEAAVAQYADTPYARRPRRYRYADGPVSEYDFGLGLAITLEAARRCGRFPEYVRPGYDANGFLAGFHGLVLEER